MMFDMLVVMFHMKLFLSWWECQVPTAKCQLPKANCQMPSAKCQVPVPKGQVPQFIVFIGEEGASHPSHPLVWMPQILPDNNTGEGAIGPSVGS